MHLDTTSYCVASSCSLLINAIEKSVDPSPDGRTGVEWHSRGALLKKDQVWRRIRYDLIYRLIRKQAFLPDERGHRTRPRLCTAASQNGLAPQSVNLAKTRCRSRLNENDQTQITFRQAADFIRLHGRTKKLCRH